MHALIYIHILTHLLCTHIHTQTHTHTYTHTHIHALNTHIHTLNTHSHAHILKILRMNNLCKRTDGPKIYKYT